MAIYRGAGGSGDANNNVSVNEVAQSAAEAAASATASQTSATNSATSATESEAAKVLAEAARIAAELAETNAATSEGNALTYANASATSETNAATSETNAATSASNASTSETNAATSESNASTAETNALASANAAATSESNAATSETNAGVSETNAAASAAASLASKNASESAALASTIAANEASASAANAATSESNAATSETNALASQVAAELAETNINSAIATNATNVSISGGTINGTVIGDVTPTSATFTGLIVDGVIEASHAGDTTTAVRTSHDGTTGLILSADWGTQYTDLEIEGRDVSINRGLVTPLTALKVEGATGDVSFYEDTGTTAKMMWDASTERLGIGTTTPAASLDLSTTDAIVLPSGTTAQRPTPESGMLRYNTTDATFEGYNGSAWGGIGGGATGGSGNAVFIENETNVTADYTIKTGYNAGSFGPITIDSGVTVSIPSGSVWTIV